MQRQLSCTLQVRVDVKQTVRIQLKIAHVRLLFWHPSQLLRQPVWHWLVLIRHCIRATICRHPGHPLLEMLTGQPARDWMLDSPALAVDVIESARIVRPVHQPAASTGSLQDDVSPLVQLYHRLVHMNGQSHELALASLVSRDVQPISEGSHSHQLPELLLASAAGVLGRLCQMGISWLLQRRAAACNRHPQLVAQPCSLLGLLAPCCLQAISHPHQPAVFSCLQVSLPPPHDGIYNGARLLPDSNCVEQVWLCLPQLPPTNHQASWNRLSRFADNQVATGIESLVSQPRWLPDKGGLHHPTDDVTNSNLFSRAPTEREQATRYLDLNSPRRRCPPPSAS